MNIITKTKVGINMLKPFSQSVSIVVDSVSSESLSPLRPFSESISISTYQETLAVVQPGKTIEDYIFSKLNKIPWWKTARKLIKKGARWEEILDAVKFSYAGKNPSIQIGDKQAYWGKILQNGFSAHRITANLRKHFRTPLFAC